MSAGGVFVVVRVYVRVCPLADTKSKRDNSSLKMRQNTGSACTNQVKRAPPIASPLIVTESVQRNADNTQT